MPTLNVMANVHGSWRFSYSSSAAWILSVPILEVGNALFVAKAFFFAIRSCQKKWLPDVFSVRGLPCEEANGRDGSALLSMGLDLYVAKGDEEFFAERMASYLGFHEFRKAWAQLLGFDLDEMQGFGGTQPWTTEPLRCFFDHSDCEGEISRQDAEQILAEARKDAPRLPNFDWAFSVLIRACESAVAKKLPISFC